MSQSDPTGQKSEELTFEQELAAVERSLQDLKERHVQVQQAEQQQAHLQQRQTQIKKYLASQTSPELVAELNQIETQLEELEFNLESRLFTWSSLKEPFWQIIRFGGLGLLIGWFLAFLTLRSPQPSSSPSGLPPSRESVR
jgi:chromosome segregation ATPase